MLEEIKKSLAENGNTFGEAIKVEEIQDKEAMKVLAVGDNSLCLRLINTDLRFTDAFIDVKDEVLDVIFFKNINEDVMLYNRVVSNIDNLYGYVSDFIDDVERGSKDLLKTKRKLSSKFKAPLKLYVSVPGRVTLVDKNNDLIILDKVLPKNTDYQKYHKQYMINRRVLLERERNEK